MSSLKAKTCPHCNANFSGRKHSIFCSHDCKTAFDALEKVKISHQQYNESNTEDWVECPCCDLRSSQLTGQHFAKHGFLSTADFKAKYPEFKIISVSLLKKMSDRAIGEKNPAFGHGGRLSPYSVKFTKYSDKTESEKREIITTLAKQASSTKIENHNNPLSVEYYIKRGSSLQEAEELVSERQRTFTLDKCIEKHGVENGTKIWQDRQDRWLASLNSKSAEEKQEINKRKSTKINFNSLWTNELDSPGNFYIVKINERSYKIGITSRTALSKRYPANQLNTAREVLFHPCLDINHAFQVEQLVKRKYISSIKEGDYGGFGWTEVINDVKFEQLFEDCTELILDAGKAKTQFESLRK